MSIRLPILQSTLEHVQLNFGVIKKHVFAEIKLDTQNLTKAEIARLREVLGLEPLTEWYPKVMRDIVVWSFFKKVDDPSLDKARRTFEHKYNEITGLDLQPEMWTDKTLRHKQNGKHARSWAAKVVDLCADQSAAISELSPN